MKRFLKGLWTLLMGVKNALALLFLLLFFGLIFVGLSAGGSKAGIPSGGGALRGGRPRRRVGPPGGPPRGPGRAGRPGGGDVTGTN